MKKNNIAVIGGLIFSSGLFGAGSAMADHHGHGRLHHYEVTLTNLMPGQPIAPMLVTTHQSGTSFFMAGDAPSEELAYLAEAGNGHPMADKLQTMAGFTSAVVGTGGTPPGQTSMLTIAAHKNDHVSLGAMLGNTNDAFAALSDRDLPRKGQSVTYYATAYDAGTETNDESCATVPGPACGGEALSPGDNGEGFVYVHNGIHGIGGLDAALYDWRNPVAKIVIKRID